MGTKKRIKSFVCVHTHLHFKVLRLGYIYERSPGVCVLSLIPGLARFLIEEPSNSLPETMAVTVLVAQLEQKGWESQRSV